MEIDLRIRDILASPSRLKDKVRIFLEEVKNQSDGSEGQRALLKFLFNSGHYQELCALIVEMLERQASIPWDLLLEMLSRAEKIPSKDSILKSLAKGMEKQSAYASLWAVISFDHAIPEFSAIRKTFAQSLKSQVQERRDELIEKFHFLKLQNLTSEARRVLMQLRSSYPEDIEISEIESQFEEEWARDLLSERAVNRSLNTQTLTLAKRSTGELEFLSFLLENALELLDQDSEMARRDLALLFLFLDAPELGLEILDKRTKSKALSFSDQWLKAELLKRSGRHIEALEQADVIENIGDGLSVGQTDSTFAVIYFKAEVYGELKQFDTALSLLDSISKIRPNYRSTNYLINLWRNRGSEG